jgi:hypothetical protein
MQAKSRGRARIIYLLALALAVGGMATAKSGDQPFGGDRDVAFAEDLWGAMAGYESWPMRSDVYPGTSPHGEFLRMFYNVVNLDDEPYHVIVKDNYAGPDVGSVASAPAEHLQAVTVMVQRRPGYDPPNGDWFWVKYQPDGGIATNPRGRQLAGRVAKGAQQGCIACHGNAGGGDFVFSNDRRAGHH